MPHAWEKNIKKYHTWRGYKEALFSDEEGQELLARFCEKAARMIIYNGAMNMDGVLACGGVVGANMNEARACVQRLVEMGVLKEIKHNGKWVVYEVGEKYEERVTLIRTVIEAQKTINSALKVMGEYAAQLSAEYGELRRMWRKNQKNNLEMERFLRIAQ